MNTVAA
jgi:hypothetical protein